jgi:hypothetical protein
MNFCKFKHVFGKEGEGIHKYRFLNIAIFDFLATFFGAIIIAYIFKFNYIITIFVVFLVGILSHRLFCVNTTINKTIFGIV